jgi:hypothetical protein
MFNTILFQVAFYFGMIANNCHINLHPDVEYKLHVMVRLYITNDVPTAEQLEKKLQKLGRLLEESGFLGKDK